MQPVRETDIVKAQDIEEEEEEEGALEEDPADVSTLKK